jgi:hypothetical protein
MAVVLLFPSMAFAQQDCADISWGAPIVYGAGGSAQRDLVGKASVVLQNSSTPPQDGELAGRPADPDSTGGFYHPVVAFGDGAPVLAAVRVRCGIANVDQETYVAWNQGYASNANPDLLALELDDVPLSPFGDAFFLEVEPGEQVTLTASWPWCEEAPCGGAETYAVYDPVSRELVPRREALSVAWFASGGALALARNGRDGDDPSPARPTAGPRRPRRETTGWRRCCATSGAG